MRGTESIDFYDRNGGRFFAETVGADMSASRVRFLTHMPPGGAILDAGCGSGRDSIAFADAGYAVTAFDGSTEMVRLASTHAGVPVLHKQFSEVDWVDAFDGIWTCASLLHVPRRVLPDVMVRLARALRPGGTWFLSFKYGKGERQGVQGRWFTDMTEELLTGTIAQTGMTLVDMWLSGDVRPGRAHEIWIGALAKRPL